MRNSTRILTAAMLLATLAACGKKSADEATPPAVSAEPADIAPVVEAKSGSLMPVQAGISPLDVLQLATVSSTKAPCSIDLIAGQAVGEQPIAVVAGANVLFQGWISTPGLQSPDAFAVVLAGSAQAYAILGKAGADRPDVARILKQEGLAKSGFNVNSKFDGVAPGEYTVSFIQDDNGATVQCPTKARIVVSAP